MSRLEGLTEDLPPPSHKIVERARSVASAAAFAAAVGAARRGKDGAHQLLLERQPAWRRRLSPRRMLPRQAGGHVARDVARLHPQRRGHHRLQLGAPDHSRTAVRSDRIRAPPSSLHAACLPAGIRAPWCEERARAAARAFASSWPSACRRGAGLRDTPCLQGPASWCSPSSERAGGGGSARGLACGRGAAGGARRLARARRSSRRRAPPGRASRGSSSDPAGAVGRRAAPR